MPSRRAAPASALVLAVTAALLGPAAGVPMVGPMAGTPAAAAPTPVDPGPPSPATQRLAFTSEHHPLLIGLDLDSDSGPIVLFRGSYYYETDRDASGSAGAESPAIAFVGLRPNAGPVERDGDIWYAANPFDSEAPEPRPLTRDDHVDRQPSLSPDGQRVAFASTREGNTDIWVIEVDGAGLTRLTRDPADDDWPSWSPDGSRLVFRSTRDDADGDLYVMPATGEAGEAGETGGEGAEGAEGGGDGARRLTASPGADGEPAWAPAGGRIAFTTDRWDARGHLAIVDADTGAVDRVGDGTWHGSQPAWSPGGDELAYTSFDSDRRGDVLTVGLGPGGGEPVPAAAAPGTAETDPTWSTRNDRFLIYTAADRDPTEGPAENVLRVNVDGTGLTDITARPIVNERRPAYAPDGRRLAYLSEEDNDMRVAIANADGTEPRILNGPDPVSYSTLSWSPDGALLAYGHDPGIGEPSRIVIVRVSDGALVASVPQPGSGPEIGDDFAPAWSPDGGTIAFARSFTEPSETQPSSTVRVSRIYLVDLDRAGDSISFGIPRQLTDGPQVESHSGPAWSPDGERLAYDRYIYQADQAAATIDVIDVDEPSLVRRLVDFGAQGWVTDAAFSPDGSLVAFSGGRSDTRWGGLFAIPVSGGPGDEFVVIDEEGDDYAPSWQPFADLRVHAAVRPDAIPLGSTAVATFTVVNDGPVASPGTGVTLTVPAGLAVEVVEASQGGCDPDAGTCALGTLPVGAAAAVEVRVRGAALGAYDLAASATGDVIDVDTSDNRDSTALRVGRGPDLAVAVAVAPKPGYVGGEPIVVTYTIRNEGEFPAADVRLVAAVPADLPVLPGAGCVPGPPCGLGTLGPDQTITVRVSLRPAVAVNGLATALVSTSGLDLDPADDTASHPVVVIQPVLELDPPVGRRGSVTDAIGRDFPPGALVALAWEPGLTAEDRPVRVAADGTFRVPVLIVPKDLLGERELRATPVRGPAFTVAPPLFLVVPGAAQPRDFVLRN